MGNTQTPGRVKYTTKHVERMARDCVVNAYLFAKANAALWRERVDAVKVDLLRLVKATYARGGTDRAGQPITNPAHDWRMADDQWADYITECRQEWAARKWITEAEAKEGICPALRAEELERLAARAMLLKASTTIDTFDPDGLLCAGLDTYRKALDLVVGVTINHPTYRKPTVNVRAEGGAA
jgi:hypothetical protein